MHKIKIMDITNNHNVVSVSKSGFSIVEKDGLYGILNKDNKLIYEYEYITLEFVFTNKCIAKQIHSLAWLLIDLTTKNKKYLLNRFYTEDADNSHLIIYGKSDYLCAEQQIDVTSFPVDIFIEGDKLYDYLVDFNEQAENDFDDYEKDIISLEIKIGNIEGTLFQNGLFIEKGELGNFINGRAKASSGYKFGIVDDHGNIIIPFKYTLIEEFVDGKARAKINDKWGVIDEFGNHIVDNEYELSNGLIKGDKFGKWGVRTIANHIVIPYEYDVIEEYIDGLIKTKKSYRWGFIDDQGVIVIPFDYCHIGEFKEGKAIASKYISTSYIDIKCKKYKGKDNEVYGLIDNKGNEIIGFRYEYLGEFSNGLSLAGKKIKISNSDYKILYGFINEQQKEVITIEYQDLYEFINGIAKAKKDNKWGCIDKHEKVIIPFEYEDMEVSTSGLVKLKKGYNGKWGCIDKHGNTILPFNYDNLTLIEDGRIMTKYIWGNWGTFDRNGNVIISESKMNNGLIKGERYGKFGIRTEDNKVIVPYEYDEIEPFVNGKAKARKDYRWGIFDEHGNINVAFIYDEIEKFIDGKARARKDKKWGSIDEIGNELIENEIELPNGLFLGKKFNLYGLRSISNEIIVPYLYDFINEFKNGKAIASKNSKWGILDDKGNELSPFEYENIQNFVDGLAIACKLIGPLKFYDDWGIIDENGNEIPENEIEVSNGYIIGQKFTLFGVRTKENITVISYEYEEIMHFANNIFKVSTNDNWGLIEVGNGIILPIEFKDIGPLYEGKARVCLEFDKVGWNKKKVAIKYGCINSKADFIIPLEFSFIDNFINGKARAKIGVKWGFIDEIGSVIIPFIYDEISNFKYGKARAKIDKNWGLIDEQGKIVVPFYYDAISDFQEGKAKVRLGSGEIDCFKSKYKNSNYFNYVDTNGFLIFSTFFSRIGEFVSGKAIAIITDLNGFEKYGCVCEKGDILIPFEYDRLTYFDNGIAIAMQNGTYYRINEQGVKVILNEDEAVEEYLHQNLYEESNNVEFDNKKTLYWIIYDIDSNFKSIGLLLQEWGSECLEISFNYGDYDELIHNMHSIKKFSQIRKFPESWDGKDIAYYLSLQKLLTTDNNLRLSRIIINRNYQIFLPEFNNMEIEMTPLPKAVFFLFLKHPEGIIFKDLQNYKDELTEIYKRTNKRENIDITLQSIEDVTNPLKNSINEKCSRIREAFVSKIDENLAKYYYITGERSTPKKIIIDRSLVVWE